MLHCYLLNKIVTVNMLQLSPMSQMNNLDNEMATESQATPQICGLKRKRAEKIRKSYSMYRRLKMRGRKKKQLLILYVE